MSSIKTNIPKSYLIAAFNQVNNYLMSMNYMPDLPEISPDRYGADAFFGGEGDWNQEVDSVPFNALMTELADNISVQMFRMKRNNVESVYVERIKDPSESTGTLFGYDDLFERAAPDLL